MGELCRFFTKRRPLMAKIAQVGYGSKGQGVGKHPNGYTYVVNDNVRTYDVIQVISTSPAGRKFATTAVPLHTYSENTVKGKTAKIDAEKKVKEITRSYTGGEEGISRRGVTRQQYRQSVRGANIAKYKEEHPDSEFSSNSQETYEEYSKKFIDKEQGERGD